MFSRIPVLVFTTILVVLIVVNLVLQRYLTADAAFPFQLLLSAWGLLTIARLVLEPIGKSATDATGASKPKTRVSRLGEVIYWLMAAAAVILGIVMVQTMLEVGASSWNIIALFVPAFVFALGKGVRYVLAGY